MIELANALLLQAVWQIQGQYGTPRSAIVNGMIQAASQRDMPMAIRRGIMAAWSGQGSDLGNAVFLSAIWRVVSDGGTPGQAIVAGMLQRLDETMEVMEEHGAPEHLIEKLYDTSMLLLPLQRDPDRMLH